uniref:Uncharacterized protein n=1 Tax=Picea sitchensis TaxID=3332 RepID=D5AB09_PICSI|nr:unknown [Picea sitchensis]
MDYMDGKEPLGNCWCCFKQCVPCIVFYGLEHVQQIWLPSVTAAADPYSRSGCLPLQHS